MVYTTVIGSTSNKFSIKERGTFTVQDKRVFQMEKMIFLGKKMHKGKKKLKLPKSVPINVSDGDEPVGLTRNLHLID
ncbi:hypothetical protein F152LOC_02064 [Pectobacterium brasiliense]|nr:hypothetical protein F152LOC_02064 [Pectobacterium brasiliense]